MVEKEGVPALAVVAISSTQSPHPALKPCLTATCQKKERVMSEWKIARVAFSTGTNSQEQGVDSKRPCCNEV